MYLRSQDWIQPHAKITADVWNINIYDLQVTNSHKYMKHTLQYPLRILCIKMKETFYFCCLLYSKCNNWWRSHVDWKNNCWNHVVDWSATDLLPTSNAFDFKFTLLDLLLACWWVPSCTVAYVLFCVCYLTLT
jgi:hypothetical protein